MGRFRTALEELTGGADGYRYLLAVSGGADSTVMAHLFHEAGLDMAIAHCNFHLRGEDSNHDMRLVQQLAGQMKDAQHEFIAAVTPEGTASSSPLPSMVTTYRTFWSPFCSAINGAAPAVPAARANRTEKRRHETRDMRRDLLN